MLKTFWNTVKQRRDGNSIYGYMTKPEYLLNQYLSKKFENEWAYNGCLEQGIVLDQMVPDFVNINGKKKIIELYGDYWHQDDDPVDRISLFKGYGYDTLVVWERELDDVCLKSKILEFSS